ncbi:hypothetical protein [Sediminibacillus massiliensis]|uniref:hypothetical protein n=1 Tax=Sediminibacillus massiliensis TaxID=1926277 RepID=UPI00098835CF|nr:hypothetical protein [Sediminibacillus massiliensis]
MRDSKKSIERGQSITFRVPSDTPEHLLKQLQQLKETERRNFSSRIAQFVLQGVNESRSKQKETVTIPLPRQLTKEQRNWLKHEHSEALIGSILYHLLMDPMRATTLLASLNSNAYDIDEALYLQEDEIPPMPADPEKYQTPEEIPAAAAQEEAVDDWDVNSEDDLNNFSLENLGSDLHGEEEESPEEEEDLLGDFLSSMNK